VDRHGEITAGIKREIRTNNSFWYDAMEVCEEMCGAAWRGVGKRRLQVFMSDVYAFSITLA